MKTKLNAIRKFVLSFVNKFRNHGWIDVNDQLPEEKETVFISDGKGWTSVGCLVYIENNGWFWAEHNGIIYQDGDKIVAECELDDLEVRYWHKFPKTLIKHKK
jgi:hypothetical protein